MNRIIIVNLGGNAYSIEDGGYDALRNYLDEARRRLGQNPDKEEILADIEQAIADKFRATLSAGKTVIETRDVTAILAGMGPIEDEAAPEPAGEAHDGERAGESGAAAASFTEAKSAAAPRRLFRIPDGAMIRGVCNGFAAYFGVDPMLVRIVLVAFVILTALFSSSLPWIFVLAYWVLSTFLPVACTPDEVAAARGDPSTARDFIRRAREGYYEAMRNLGDKGAQREFKEKCRREMHSWRRSMRHAMRESARHHAGSHTWQATYGASVVPGFALPVLGLMEAALVVATIVAIFQLIAGGTAFGYTVPADIPVWIAIVALVFVMQVVTWPIKVMRHAYHVQLTGEPFRVRPYPGFFDTLVWLAAVAAAVWLADRYIPGVHEFIVALPSRMHEVTESVKQWWHGTSTPVGPE